MTIPRAADLPIATVAATKKRVWIKRYEREDGPYWIEAGAFAVQVSDRQMQAEMDVEPVEVLRVGDGSAR